MSLGFFLVPFNQTHGVYLFLLTSPLSHSHPREKQNQHHWVISPKAYIPSYSTDPHVESSCWMKASSLCLHFLDIRMLAPKLSLHRPQTYHSDSSPHWTPIHPEGLRALGESKVCLHILHTSRLDSLDGLPRPSSSDPSLPAPSLQPLDTLFPLHILTLVTPVLHTQLGGLEADRTPHFSNSARLCCPGNPSWLLIDFFHALNPYI